MDEDEEVANEEKFDEFAHCFARGYEVKMLNYLMNFILKFRNSILRHLLSLLYNDVFIWYNLYFFMSLNF